MKTWLGFKHLGDVHHRIPSRGIGPTLVEVGEQLGWPLDSECAQQIETCLTQLVSELLRPVQICRREPLWVTCRIPVLPSLEPPLVIATKPSSESRS